MPFMTKRVVPITERDLFTLMNEKTPFIVVLSKPAQDILSSLGIFGGV
jgi:hypothetical protein